MGTAQLKSLYELTERRVKKCLVLMFLFSFGNYFPEIHFLPLSCKSTFLLLLHFSLKYLLFLIRCCSADVLILQDIHNCFKKKVLHAKINSQIYLKLQTVWFGLIEWISKSLSKSFCLLVSLDCRKKTS